MRIYIHFLILISILTFMNKTEFVSEVAAKAGLSKVDGKKAVEAAIQTISEEIAKGGKVAIIGFGTYSVAEKAARKGVNPKTKEAIDIPARKVVKFKAGADLANAVK
jgi:DNA-binding protein HU-beta